MYTFMLSTHKANLNTFMLSTNKANLNVYLYVEYT